MWRFAEGAAFLQGGGSSQLLSMAALVLHVKAIESLTRFGPTAGDWAVAADDLCRTKPEVRIRRGGEVKRSAGKDVLTVYSEQKQRTAAAQELQQFRA